MVSSDTVVGIVGAGILVVALVGVFIYEANSADSAAQELGAASFPYSVQGSSTHTPAEQPAAGGQCTGDAAPACEPQLQEISITVQGLPSLNELSYGAFVVSGGSPTFIGALSPQGQNHVLDYSEDADHSAATMVLITLETTATPGSPGLELLNGTISGGTISGEGNLTLASTMTQSVTMNDSGNSTSVSGTLTGLPAHEGFEYKVWLRADTGAGALFRLVENVSIPADANGTFDAPFVGTAEDRPPEGWSQLIVSLEAPGSDLSVIGGFPVYTLDLTSTA